VRNRCAFAALAFAPYCAHATVVYDRLADGWIGWNPSYYRETHHEDAYRDFHSFELGQRVSVASYLRVTNIRFRCTNGIAPSVGLGPTSVRIRLYPVTNNVVGSKCSEDIVYPGRMTAVKFQESGLSAPTWEVSCDGLNLFAGETGQVLVAVVPNNLTDDVFLIHECHSGWMNDLAFQQEAWTGQSWPWDFSVSGATGDALRMRVEAHFSFRQWTGVPVH
jgi:hypothetical protein